MDVVVSPKVEAQQSKWESPFCCSVSYWRYRITVYINRFHEMEDELTIINPSDISLGELASYLKIMDKVAVRQNLAPHKIAENFKKVSAQFGVELTEDFVNGPEYEQLTLESLGK